MPSKDKKSKIQLFKDLYEDGRRFLLEELWTKDISTLSAMKRLCFAFCRICIIVAKGFQQDNCSLQASALTYITLVSLVPMLAIMFSFSKGLGMQNKLLDNIGLARYEIVNENGSNSWAYKIAERTTDNAIAVQSNQESEQNGNTSLAQDSNQPLAQKLPPPMQEALIKIFEYVENTSFAALGLIGSIMLLFSVIGSMSKLENSFNKIWGVKKPRNFMRKCSEYLVVLILVPIIFIVLTSLNTILLSNGFVQYLQSHFGQVASIMQFLVRIIGYFFVLFGFGFFYMFMPNTRVKAFPGIIGGLTAGIMWFAIQWAYLHLQVGLTKFNSIYGTFAVLPFFLAWLYANWSIVLLGAEISFAVQNHRTIHIEKAAEDASIGVCIVLGELLLFEACRAFKNGNGPWSPTEFGLEKNIPTRIIRHVVDILTKSSLLVRVQSDGIQAETFLPGRDISQMTPADVEEAFRENQSLNTKMYVQALPKSLREKYQQTYKEYANSLSTMTFGGLIDEEAKGIAQ